jgi:hypothetical protein
MALARVAGSLSKQGPPPEVQDRLKRGAARRDDGKPWRQEAWAFFRGEQYSFVNSERQLIQQPTVVAQNGTGKPSHRQRRVYNLITPVVGHKVSQATSRVPGYEVNPSTQDESRREAAGLSRKVLWFGYEQWDLSRAAEDVVTHALVGDEGFAWPFFDTTIGPFIDDGDGGQIGQGDVRVRTFGANEVYWEPGLRFEESRWHAVEQARPASEVKAMPGYKGGKLTPDATTKQGSSERVASNTDLVLVVDYLERPSKEWPEGRWITVANDRVICEQGYPCRDHEDKVLDEPVLHKLAFITDPDSDRDMGLVRFLVDPQRTFSHANNKQVEWMTLALNPQAVVKNGTLRQRLNDMPGMVYNFTGSGEVQWRETPPMPPELSTIKDEARTVLQFIAADQDIPEGVDAARAVAAFTERDQAVWQKFYANLAKFHSRLARHCLYLVQRFYTEERVVYIKGPFGTESVENFMGAQLLGQADVTVLPGSIEPRTRQQIDQKVAFFAAQGWITPEAAMHAMNGGDADNLIQDIDYAVARVHRTIQAIKAGENVLLGGPEIVVGIEPATLPLDPLTGIAQPNPTAGSPIMAPVWMPRYTDNIPVWKSVLNQWFQTEDYERLPQPMQVAANLIQQKVLELDAQKQMEAAQAQQAMAEGQGMANAASPQGPKALPDGPTPEGNQLPTMNQPPDQMALMATSQ